MQCKSTNNSENGKEKYGKVYRSLAINHKNPSFRTLAGGRILKREYYKKFVDGVLCYSGVAIAIVIVSMRESKQ